MSKRVEELLRELDGIDILRSDKGYSYGSKRHYTEVERVALIDAELRKERERAADRASGYLNSLNAREDCTHDGLRAAILSDEED